DRQHADHDASAPVALRQRVGIEAFADPVECGPERAISEWTACGWPGRKGSERGARAAGVDYKVEATDVTTACALERGMSGARIQRHDLVAGLDGDALRLDGAMQDAKQGRTMNREAEAALSLRVIAHVQHGAAAFRVA